MAATHLVVYSVRHLVLVIAIITAQVLVPQDAEQLVAEVVVVPAIQDALPLAVVLALVDALVVAVLLVLLDVEHLVQVDAVVVAIQDVPLGVLVFALLPAVVPVGVIVPMDAPMDVTTLVMGLVIQNA